MDFSKPDRRWRFLFSSSPEKPPFRHYSLPRLLSSRDYHESVWLENKPLPSTKFYEKMRDTAGRKKNIGKNRKTFQQRNADWLIFIKRPWPRPKLLDSSIDFSIDWLMDRLIDWFRNKLIDWLTDWSIYWFLFDPSIDWLIDQFSTCRCNLVSFCSFYNTFFPSIGQQKNAIKADRTHAFHEQRRDK